MAKFTKSNESKARNLGFESDSRHRTIRKKGSPAKENH